MRADDAQDSPRPLPFYARVTIAGLVVVTVVLLFHLGLSLLQGTPGDLTFIAPFAGLSMLVAGFVWKLGRKSALVASIFAVLMLILNSPFLLFPLTHPDSFFDFSISLVVVTGLLIATVGGAVAYVQLGRGTARETATPVEIRAFGAIALAVVALSIVSALVYLGGRTTVSAAAKEDSVELVMAGVRYDPEHLEVPAGETTRLLVKNKDFTLHTITIERIGIDETFRSRSEAIVGLPALKAGSYDIVCTVPGHEKMTGILIVTPAVN